MSPTSARTVNLRRPPLPAPIDFNARRRATWRDQIAPIRYPIFTPPFIPAQIPPPPPSQGLIYETNPPPSRNPSPHQGLHKKGKSATSKISTFCARHLTESPTTPSADR